MSSGQGLDFGVRLLGQTLVPSVCSLCDLGQMTIYFSKP